MTDKTVTLRLATDARGVAPGVNEAGAKLESLGAKGKRAGQSITDGMHKADDEVKRVGQSSNVAAGMISRLFAAAAGAQVLRTAVALADEYTNIGGRLKLAASTQAEFAKSQAETFAISQRTSTALESTVALYTRLSKATQEYGVSQERNLAISETINKTFAISGASADAQKNSVTQLTQALAGGVLRAEEFNSIIENSPRLAQALADGMGISMGQLRAHVNDGQVTVERMVQALEGQASAIEREFEQIPLTVERSLVQLRNSFVALAGEVSNEVGASSAIAQGVSDLAAKGISVLAQNLGALDKVAGVVAVAFGGRLVASLVSATAAKVATVVATRQAAVAELEAARAAQVAATARLSAARAGLGAAGSLVLAEQSVAAATARTAAATQAASLAATAKAASMRALSGAMAMFGGPVGLAITALALFVMWAMKSSAKAKELAESVRVGFQPAIDKLEQFSEATANTDFAGLDEQRDQMQKTAEQVEALSDKYQQLRDSRMRAVAQDMPTDFYDRQLEEKSREIDQARIKLDALNAGYERAIDISSDLILKKAGIADATEDERRKLEALVNEQVKQRTSLEYAKPKFVEYIASIRDAGTAARLAAADFKELQNATKFDWSDVDKNLDKQLNQARLRLIEQEQGKAAAMRAEFAQDAGAQGADITSKEYQERRAKNEELIALQERFEKGQKAATEASKAATKAARDQSKATDQLKESQERYTAEAALAAAEQQGPLALAQEQSKQRIAELDKALKAHNITQASYTTLVDASKVALTKRQAELDRDIGAPQALLDAMTGELTILRQTGIQREISRRQLQTEQDMRRELATAVEAAGSKEQLATKMGAKSYREYEAAMLSAADASAAMSVAMEQSARDAEEWAAVWGDAVSSVADAFTDFVMSGLKDFSNLARDLKSIAKQLVGDLIRTFLEQKIVIPIQTQITNAMSGTSSGGSSVGGWLDQLKGMFGGGQGLTASAGHSGAGWASSKASSGSMMGFGNNVGNFVGGGAGAGAAGGMMGSMASIIPVIGWIYAGMQLNNQMYSQGWRLNGGDYSWGGAAASPFPDVAVGGAATDKLLQKLGLDAKTSSMITGTATLTALFGRKAPKVQSQGLMGSYGFDSFDGRNFADIKAKGGVFRSDKKWTEYSELNDALQDTLNVAIRRTRTTVVDLADQIGKDLSEQLSTVKVDIGKLVLDADPEKAKVQMEEFLANMVEGLAGKGVGMLGFDNLLNKGFEASEVMHGLSVAIQLMTGDAQKLGRALTADELGVVNRTVQMFEKLAAESGSTLEEQISAITGAASGYGNVVATAQQEIAMSGLSAFSKSLVAVKQEEAERIRTLQAQAKALGGLSAREEDLAKVRESAQLKTDALVTALQGELVDLALNRLNDQIQQLGGATEGTASKIEAFINSLRMSDTLSPDTDAQRRVTANDLMSTAALAGDVDAFTQYAQQFLEVSRSLNASAAGYQADYDRVMQMAKQFGVEGNAASLEQLYAQRSALQAQQEAAARLERAQRIAQGVSDLAGVNGADPLDILRSVTGMTGKDLAADLGLSEGQLDDYLAQQQTDIGDLVDVMYELPRLIAAELVSALTDKTLGAPSGGQPPATSGPSRTTTGEDKLLDTLGRLDKTLARQQVLDELKQLESQK